MTSILARLVSSGRATLARRPGYRPGMRPRDGTDQLSETLAAMRDEEGWQVTVAPARQSRHGKAPPVPGGGGAVCGGQCGAIAGGGGELRGGAGEAARWPGGWARPGQEGG